MKKIICIMALVLTLLCVLSVSALAVSTVFPMDSAVVLGDVNKDGKVEKSADTSALQAKLLNETVAATEDINADGSSDVADLVCLYLYADTYSGYVNNSGVTIGSSGSMDITR